MLLFGFFNKRYSLDTKRYRIYREKREKSNSSKHAIDTSLTRQNYSACRLVRRPQVYATAKSWLNYTAASHADVSHVVDCFECAHTGNGVGALLK